MQWCMHVLLVQSMSLQILLNFDIQCGVAFLQYVTVLCERNIIQLMQFIKRKKLLSG